MEKSNLEKLKEKYEEFRKRYNLPSFKEMNENFEIEKLQERETELLLREIRRGMMEKNVAYLRFVEMFMNPQTAPMLFLALIKNMNHVDRKLLEELYSELGKFEILSLQLDNSYDERKEAEFVKKLFEEWKEIKVKFGDVLKILEDSWDRKQDRKEKGYLG